MYALKVYVGKEEHFYFTLLFLNVFFFFLCWMVLNVALKSPRSRTGLPRKEDRTNHPHLEVPRPYTYTHMYMTNRCGGAKKKRKKKRVRR